MTAPRSARRHGTLGGTQVILVLVAHDAKRFAFLDLLDDVRKNAGQHNATMAGLARARGRQIVIMDDDLQHPPEAVASLLAQQHDLQHTAIGKLAEVPN